MTAQVASDEVLRSITFGSEAPTGSVRKRDGTTVQEFDLAKIERAVTAAWKCVKGLVDDVALSRVVNTVVTTLPPGTVDVETVQDSVELSLMRHGHFEVAKAYILFRHERTQARLLRGKKPDPKAVSDYIHASKYARYRPDLGRREVYEETVARVEGKHLGRFPQMESEIRKAFDLVREKRVLPSMRSMQFAGPAILGTNNRLFNCCFSLIDRLEAFSEAFYLLFCGSGVGYSIQFEHVEKLPPVGYVDPKRIRHHVIEDTIEGCADAMKALLQSYQEGVHLEISYHLIRDAGRPLVVSGGKAPGHRRLKESLEHVRRVLDGAQGRKLRPIECHRILTHGADAVLSGGIRRSAMIALFSLDDSEMMNCKTGNWFEKEPWFANANNSVCLKRDEVQWKQFKRIFQMTKEFGEPAFVFMTDMSSGVNPCVEASLNPVLVIDEELHEALAAKGIATTIGDRYTGWGFCNLCEINAAAFTSEEDFFRAAKAATLIGTLQASYTSMPYLGWVSEEVARREALLGVSMTGMLDAPQISCDPDLQRRVALKVNEWNREFAARVGVRPAARTTCVKPSGTASLALGCTGSGHHAHHARRYLRRVTADELETVFQAYRAKNPHACLRKPDGKWIVEFPVEAPAGAILKSDMTAIEFLEKVKSTQQNWVLPGTARPESSPGVTHNVSNTVTVKPGEWDSVAEYLWTNREFFTGVSLLPDTGDKIYAFAPLEEISTPADESRWNALLAGYQPLDYTTLVEDEDATDLTAEPACAGGACEVR
jgi:ribonucleoside-triphosphate reductase